MLHRKGIPIRNDIIRLSQRLVEAGLIDRWMEEVLKTSGSGKATQGKVIRHVGIKVLIIIILFSERL